MTIIIGAGIAGLTCAKYLNDKGLPFIIIEAADAVGGRVRTDIVEGFRLDRGFQILLTAYPEAQQLLDYEALDLQKFRSGTMIRQGDKFTTMGDPFKEPSTLFSTLFAPIGSLADKLRIWRLIDDVDSVDDTIFEKANTDTLTFLENYGFSEKAIQQFFRPFFGGVFLDDSLRTSASLFQFLFKQFYQGDVAVPRNGMSAIPEQIAQQLPQNSIRLNTKVLKIEDKKR